MPLLTIQFISMKFISCTTPLDLKRIPKTSNCTDNLESQYTVIKTLGTGDQGVVFQVVNNKTLKHFAVKVAKSDLFAVRGINIACHLNSINKQTPIFSKTIGWFPCKTTLRKFKWVTDLQLKQKDIPQSTDPYIFTMIERNEYKWIGDDIVVDDEVGFKSALFLLLHGLYVARKEFAFGHNDIHKDQLMLQPNPNRSVHVNIEDETFRVNTGRFIPKLIDFDLSQINNDSRLVDSTTDLNDDIVQIESIFNKKSPKNKEFKQLLKSSEWTNMKNATRFDYDEIVDVLYHPYFDSILQQETIDPIEYRCSRCAQPAAYNMYGTEWSFCDEICSKLFIPH